MAKNATQPAGRSGNSQLENLGFGGLVAPVAEGHFLIQTGLHSWSVEGPRTGIELSAKADSLPREAPG